MIITLRSANFNSSNIGTLSTWRITRSLGAGATYVGPNAIDKEGTLTATITIAEGYELAPAGVTVTMGGVVLTDATNIQGNTIYISIPVVGGNVVIKVPTVNLNGGTDEPEIVPVTLSSISVGYNQGKTTMFEAQDVEDLRRYLTVTGLYSDGSTAPITDFTLSGTLTPGTSTITVGKDSRTNTFTVETTALDLPEGYTKYGYIQRKVSAKGSTYAEENFIILPTPDEINTLSLEQTIGQKPNATNAAIGIWGARPASGMGCCIYWNGTDSDPFNVRVRNVQLNVPEAKDLEKIKLVIDNKQSSPYDVYVNGTKYSKEWTVANDVLLDSSNTRITLFNNIPYGNTAGMYINFTVRLGAMLFRNYEGECVAYFVPCTDESKRIGMYDVVSKTFYTASKAAAVTVGNSGVLYQVANW